MTTVTYVSAAVVLFIALFIMFRIVKFVFGPRPAQVHVLQWDEKQWAILLQRTKKQI